MDATYFRPLLRDPAETKKPRGWRSLAPDPGSGQSDSDVPLEPVSRGACAVLRGHAQHATTRVYWAEDWDLAVMSRHLASGLAQDRHDIVVGGKSKDRAREGVVTAGSRGLWVAGEPGTPCPHAQGRDSWLAPQLYADIPVCPFHSPSDLPRGKVGTSYDMWQVGENLTHSRPEAVVVQEDRDRWWEQPPGCSRSPIRSPVPGRAKTMGLIVGLRAHVGDGGEQAGACGPLS